MRKNRIDHDLRTCKDIKYSLKSETTEAYYTLTIQDGLSALAKQDYEVVICNVCFPDTDGMELLKTLRCMKPMPILLLSTSSALADKVQALEAGADDFLTKPFETEECLARVHALRRRFTELNPLKSRAYTIAAQGDLVIQRENRQALLSGRPLPLTYREFELISLLVFTRSEYLLMNSSMNRCGPNRTWAIKIALYVK